MMVEDRKDCSECGGEKTMLQIHENHWKCQECNSERDLRGKNK